MGGECKQLLNRIVHIRAAGPLAGPSASKLAGYTRVFHPLGPILDVGNHCGNGDLMLIRPVSVRCSGPRSKSNFFDLTHLESS
jgi:hypothetical protein